MKFLKYFSLSLILIIIFITYLFLNLGKILDVSEEPIKSDIIVSLGGGDIERLKKSLELYEKDFSSKRILILTGDERSKKDKERNLDDKRIKYLKENDLNSINFLLKKELTSTIEEVIFIKEYLIKNNYSSVVIVSDPPHSKRIKYLFKKIKISNDESLIFNIVKADAKWWDKESYYLNKRAKTFAFTEIPKLLYSYFMYGFLDFFGVQSSFEKYINPKAENIGKTLNTAIIKYSKN